MPPQSARLFVAAFALCCGAASRALVQPVPDGMPTYAQFEQTIQGYPYHASGERAAKVRSGLAAMKRCIEKSKVQALLGVPDFSQLAFGPKGPGDKWLGSSWVYYLSKQSRLTNENDSSVTVYFDTNGLCHWVAPRHIDGAKEIGSVSEKCA